MIKKIFIQNYKIFEQFDLELNSDLDIIVGDNEVGKSTILEELKTKIRQAQYKAVISANKEMIFLYWDIGKTILIQQERQGWGTKVIDRLAADLRHEFPEMKGFSARNLKYMRAFAEAYPDKQFVQQLAAQIPWFHNFFYRAGRPCIAHNNLFEFTGNHNEQ